MELYKKYRPSKLKEVFGQNNTVKMLQRMIKQNEIPHAILLTGPSGCGKTTLARILRKKLHCGKPDFVERNCRKIEEIREIRHRINQVPISGKSRIWLIDEAHQLTSDAQNEFLKMLEDTPSHVYFMLTTTDPQKLKRTIKTRCTEIIVKKLQDRTMSSLLTYICKEEKIKISEEVEEKIIENSDGSARKALVFLNQIMNLDDEEDMLEAIEKASAEIQAIAIAKALFNPKTKWYEMAEILKETATEEPEQVRWMVLGYAKSVLLSGGKFSGRAYLVIDAFRDHFYDSKHAGLVAACYEIIIGVKG